MTLPFEEIFIAIFAAYLIASGWAHLDSRYPIVLALCVMISDAIVDALGYVSAAATIAEYVVFLLVGGVILLAVDGVRDALRDKPASELPVAAERRPALGGDAHARDVDERRGQDASGAPEQASSATGETANVGKTSCPPPSTPKRPPKSLTMEMPSVPRGAKPKEPY